MHKCRIYLFILEGAEIEECLKETRKLLIKRGAAGNTLGKAVGHFSIPVCFVFLFFISKVFPTSPWDFVLKNVLLKPFVMSQLVLLNSTWLVATCISSAGSTL